MKLPLNRIKQVSETKFLGIIIDDKLTWNPQIQYFLLRNFSSMEILVHSSEIRYSLTFRQLAPYYVNSTVIVGDSNTHNLKFGGGRSTFGVWMPGCRIKATRIQNIPNPEELEFPYRNLVIHTGLNDIRNQNHLPSLS